MLLARRFASIRKHTVSNLSTGELPPRMGRASHRPLRALSALNISELMITLTVSRSHAVNALVTARA